MTTLFHQHSGEQKLSHAYSTTFMDWAISKMETICYLRHREPFVCFVSSRLTSGRSQRCPPPYRSSTLSRFTQRPAQVYSDVLRVLFDAIHHPFG